MASRYYDERDDERISELDVSSGDELEPPVSASEGEDSLGTPSGDADSEHGAPETRQGTGRRRTSRTSRTSARHARTDADGVIHLSQREPEAESDPDTAGESDEELIELAAKGFSAEEAIHLIHVSQRAATSREAREAEATLRRLRFTRWLIEHGMLDEFSA